MNLRRSRAHGRRAVRGYTLVEVMAALAVLAVGVTGILSMENAAVFSNRRAQEIATATNIARRWQEILTADSLLWNSPSQRSATSDLARDTRYLCVAVGCSAGAAAAANAWFVPVPQAASLDSAAYDSFGNEAAPDSSGARYCVNLRLTWLRAEAAGVPGVMRTEVRVWWYREGATRNPAYAGCGTPAGLLTLDADVANIDRIVVASAVTGHPL